MFCTDENSSADEMSAVDDNEDEDPPELGLVKSRRGDSGLEGESSAPTETIDMAEWDQRSPNSDATVAWSSAESDNPDNDFDV